MQILSKINTKYLFFIIIVIASFLRISYLDSVPPSASLDEASIGYNAYSILHTGKDEYGYFFPILLRAYDDWRPALYVYLTIPFVKVFGLNIISVRLPSVILSICTVVAVYFLIQELFKNKKVLKIDSKYLALLVTFLLAISPWHIYISRLGHEANAGFAFFIFGLLFFLKNKIYTSSLFFLTSFMSYQSEKVFVPFFICFLLAVYRKHLLRQKKKILFSLIISTLILLPFVRESIKPNALIRFQGTSVFSAQKKRYEQEAQKLLMAKKQNDVLGQLVHNRRMLTTEIFFEGYFSHFNPRWLFTNEHNDNHKVPSMGLLYIWEFPFILLGIFILLFKKLDTETKVVIFSWFLLSPISSSITTGAPHALRSFTFLPTWQIFSGIGILTVYSFLPIFLKRMYVVILVIAVTFSSYFLIRQYFYVFPYRQSQSFQLAFSKTIPFVVAHERYYTRIVFSNSENLYQSYMFFLFYSQYNPIVYLKEGGSVSGGYNEIHKFSKYEFRPILWKEEKKNNTLFIGNPEDFPIDSKFLYKEYYLDGSEGVTVVGN